MFRGARKKLSRAVKSISSCCGRSKRPKDGHVVDIQDAHLPISKMQLAVDRSRRPKDSSAPPLPLEQRPSVPRPVRAGQPANLRDSSLDALLAMYPQHCTPVLPQLTTTLQAPPRVSDRAGKPLMRDEEWRPVRMCKHLSPRELHMDDERTTSPPVGRHFHEDERRAMSPQHAVSLPLKEQHDEGRTMSLQREQQDLSAASLAVVRAKSSELGNLRPLDLPPAGPVAVGSAASLREILTNSPRTSALSQDEYRKVLTTNPVTGAPEWFFVKQKPGSALPSGVDGKPTAYVAPADLRWKDGLRTRRAPTY